MAQDATVKAGPREWVGLVVLTLPVLLIAVDLTVLGFAVPALSEDLAPHQHPTAVAGGHLLVRPGRAAGHHGQDDDAYAVAGERR